MRKGYDGLSGLVRNELGADPLSGDVYVFFSRNRRSVKLLVWDRSGFVIYYKRLEQGTFELPAGGDAKSTVLRWDELVMILEGITLGSVKRKKRFTYPQQ